MGFPSRPSHTRPVDARCDGDAMTRAERHERAVARTLGWAQEAAEREAFGEALEWLHMVERIDGALPPDWERRQASWRLMARDMHSGRAPRHRES
jgi:hypothetical protein